MNQRNSRPVPIQQAPDIPKSIRSAVMLANGTFYHLDQEPDEVVRALESLRMGSHDFVEFTGDHRKVYLSKLVTEAQLGQMPNAMAIVSVMEMGHLAVVSG